MDEKTEPSAELHETQPVNTNINTNNTKENTRPSAADPTPQVWADRFASQDQAWRDAFDKRLCRKVDARLLPMLIIIYLLNFLDRSNLAQARQGTLEKDLGMAGDDFNLATSIFFVGYLLMQLPSNLLLTRVPPSLYLAASCTLWGVVSTCNAATRSFTQLVVVRFFLGFVEAPFFPGAIFLMSSWYTRAELTRRVSWMYTGNALANMFAGLLGAAVLGNLNHSMGIAGWRWLFIIEGVIAIAFGLLTCLIMPNYPHTTKWLTEEEQAFAAWRLVQDVSEADTYGEQSVWTGVKMAVRDYRLYMFTLMQHLSLLTQSFQYFFPTIVGTLGYNNIVTLWLTAPCWFATFLLSIVVTHTAAKVNDRSIHIICLVLLAAVGNIISVGTSVVGVRYFAMFLMPMGTISAYQIIVSWVANSFPRPLVKRSACIAIANMIGNTATIYGSYMYPSSSGPQYVAGGSANAACCVLLGLLALGLRYAHKWENRKLEKAEAEAAQTAEQGEKPALDRNQERRPYGFRYVY